MRNMSYVSLIQKYSTPEQIKEYYFSSPFRLFEYYSVSKLMNIYFTQYLAEQLPKKYNYIKSVSLHPGVVNTPFFRYADSNKILSTIFYLITPIFTFFTKTPIEGSQTHMHVCYSSYEELISGGYYSDCEVTPISATARNTDIRKAVIDWSLAELKKAVPSFETNL